jgi:hypothetical protein
MHRLADVKLVLKQANARTAERVLDVGLVRKDQLSLGV